MPKKAGRPHATHPKDARITVRFTEEEMRRIDACLTPEETYAAFLRRSVAFYLAHHGAWARPDVKTHAITRGTVLTARRNARRAAQVSEPAVEAVLRASLPPGETLDELAHSART